MSEIRDIVEVVKDEFNGDDENFMIRSVILNYSKRNCVFSDDMRRSKKELNKGLDKIYFNHNVSITTVVQRVNEIIDYLKKNE